MTDASPAFLFDGPTDARATILLAHGAGAPMDSEWMNAAATALAVEGLRVARFEFAYMAGRRTGGGKKPPPKAEKVMEEYRQAVSALGARTPLIIGGKSMGGRVASMVADELSAAGKIAGLLCLGYPFHPPGKPEKLRTAHLAAMTTPALICQGARDPFGTEEEAGRFTLSPAIELRWFTDGDHDLKPRKASGLTLKSHLATMAKAASGLAERVLEAR
jgi:uncharacterized protein